MRAVFKDVLVDRALKGDGDFRLQWCPARGMAMATALSAKIRRGRRALRLHLQYQGGIHRAPQRKLLAPPAIRDVSVGSAQGANPASCLQWCLVRGTAMATALSANDDTGGSASDAHSGSRVSPSCRSILGSGRPDAPMLPSCRTN